MRILIAVDTHSYSENIINDVQKLAANTWADLTLLGVQPNANAAGPDAKWTKILTEFHKNIIAYFHEENLPYGSASSDAMTEINKGVWEAVSSGRKKLTIRLRSGNAEHEILEQAKEDESDLIVLGCTKGLDCEWEGELLLPQKIAKKAECSVLAIKEQKPTNQITGFLDQTSVSQDSLELINQLVTLHDAGLKIVGLQGQKGTIGKEDVEKKMVDVLKYYNDRKISSWMKMVNLDNLEEYVAQATKEGIIALWVGKKSLLSQIFSRDLIGKLVNQTQSSVLILR